VPWGEGGGGSCKVKWKKRGKNKEIEVCLFYLLSKADLFILFICQSSQDVTCQRFSFVCPSCHRISSTMILLLPALFVQIQDLNVT